jgi:RHS repeat-associated protein
VSAASYNANNQLTNWNGAAISYDADGNMLSNGGQGFSWNARNQLAGTNGASFQYDVFGRRTKNAAGTSFLYDGVNAVQEISGGTVSANILTGGVDENFLRSDAAGNWNFLSDSLGSTLGLTDANGTVQTQYTYDPFGNTTATGISTSNPAQYTGRENDGTGLYYYRARYYDPTIARFISEDPIGFYGGINFYSYVGNSPTNFVDPSGWDQTIWDFGGNGRYGPRNGNWGGGNWSGGWVPSEHNGQDGPFLPTDSADKCYMDHDKCYEGSCGKPDCDHKLVKCLQDLPKDPRQWPLPPRAGTEGDTTKFLNGAIGIFSPPPLPNPGEIQD